MRSASSRARTSGRRCSTRGTGSISWRWTRKRTTTRSSSPPYVHRTGDSVLHRGEGGARDRVPDALHRAELVDDHPAELLHGARTDFEEEVPLSGDHVDLVDPREFRNLLRELPLGDVGVREEIHEDEGGHGLAELPVVRDRP